MEERKESWIDREVIIDFPVPRSIQIIMDTLEEYDATENYGYFDWLEQLDYDVKEFVLLGKMTQKQRDKLNERFGG